MSSNELLVSNPTVRVEDHRHGALLEDGGVERCFPVGDGSRVVDTMVALSFPIARNNRRESQQSLPMTYGYG